MRNAASAPFPGWVPSAAVPSERKGVHMPTVTVEPDRVCVSLRDGETILEGLYRHGYAYGVGCRRGGCAVCKVQLESGSVSYTRVIAEKVLTDEEREAGVCLTCRAVADDDITIRMREQELRMVNPILARLAGSAHRSE